MSRLREVLLIDDEEADNFLHRRVLDRMGCAERVTALTDASAALRYLSTPVEGRLPCPDVLFLDLNMPVMDGWAFLDEYERLEAAARARLVVVLTTSQNPADEQQAERRELVAAFERKPLTSEKVSELLRTHFPIDSGDSGDPGGARSNRAPDRDPA